MAEKVVDVEDKLDFDSDIYSLYRKNTPEEVMSKIIHFVNEKYKGSLDVAVDVGCGTGQSTIVLAQSFKKVYGIDDIESQLEEAESTRKCSNIVYKHGPAESLPFENNSVQLVTTATSLHWFNLNLFFPEVNRILCNNGVLAAYGYTKIKPLLRSSALNEKSDELYSWLFAALDPYTKPQVKLSIQKLKNIEFPFEEVVRVPDIRCSFKGRLSDIVGYVNSYSFLKTCREKNPARGEDIFEEFKKRLYEIGENDGVSSCEDTTLYMDYVLILCRKVVSRLL